MKILIAVPYYYPLVGGSQTIVRELGKKLCQAGHEVGILTMYVNNKGMVEWKKDEIFDDGIRIIKWPVKHISNGNGYLNRICKKFFNILFIPKPGLYKIIREYDILQFHDVNDLTFPFFSLFLDIPKAFFCGTLAERFNFYKGNFLPKTVLKKSSDIFLASNENTKKLLLELGIDERKIDLLYCGVDEKKYHPDLTKKEDNILLFAGALEERKGVHVLIEALRLMKSPVKLIIAGPARDEAYTAGLLKKVSELNKETNHKIEFLNYLDEDKLIYHYQKASIFICPSLAEEFGLVSIEALACGTPVIASNTGGIPFAVKNGEHGILTTPGSPEELASAIELLLNDSELRRKFGKQGRDDVVKKYSWEKVVKSLEEIHLKNFGIK